MKKKKFTESQIVKILKEHESGRDVTDLCREHSIHRSTIYTCKKKYGGLEVQVDLQQKTGHIFKRI